MANGQAKLVRKIESGSAWYFDKYELECINCGKHYFSGRYDNRTVPYCADCKRERDSKRYKLLKEEKERRAEAVIWNKAVDKTTETIKSLYSLTIDEEKAIDKAVEKIKKSLTENITCQN